MHGSCSVVVTMLEVWSAQGQGFRVTCHMLSKQCQYTIACDAFRTGLIAKEQLLLAPYFPGEHAHESGSPNFAAIRKAVEV
eukprot:4051192-Amphidinium_carterae.1